MEKVTIYQFTIYDVMSDTMILSKRWGTLEAIKKACGNPLLETAMEINRVDLNSDIDDFTVKGFDPYNIVK